jgi:uncharacterized protein YcbX
LLVSSIFIYPIKSLKGISIEESIVEKRGLRFDRRWMLSDREGMFFTQRETPKMAAVTVKVDGDQLIASCEGVEPLAIPSEPDRGERQRVVVWQSDVDSIAYGGIVSEWFSDVLGRSCQLVLMPESSERHVSEKFDRGDDIVSFADGYPLLLIGEGSLAELNKRIGDEAERAGKDAGVPYPTNRFRPNLVVRESDPFEEDRWAKIRVGEAVFRVAKPCARCVMTTVDQARGEFDGTAPHKPLTTYRMAKAAFPDTFEPLGQTATAVLFGENLTPENPGATVRVKDPVEVLEFRR